jgi:hypothetical protein
MTTQETSLSQALAVVEFATNRQGEKGVFVPLTVWETMLTALEDVEDLTIAKDFLHQRANARTPEELGLLDWADVADEWDDDKAA